ncbi:succinate dehydrogenase, hydrophobic membrane anchor protein [Methyloferula stellata]|uniref:succinate dehydrogenase, hydrophobic membrane anchor protein n=1 Tax=Methyloferula stellata TaxID=876270 RepID=UPI000378B120|nr:succinate dehydrogenase, hydrophobic membrane anchor protein [Methyloferula stellata]
MLKSGPSSGSVQTRLPTQSAAKDATTDAWRMRVTSIALVPLAIAFVFVILNLIGKDYAAAHAQLGHTGPAILILLFLLAGIIHMKIGMQSIIDDYVHVARWKEAALMGNLFFSVVIGIACVYAVLKISFT